MKEFDVDPHIVSPWGDPWRHRLGLVLYQLLEHGISTRRLRLPSVLSPLSSAPFRVSWHPSRPFFDCVKQGSALASNLSSKFLDEKQGSATCLPTPVL